MEGQKQRCIVSLNGIFVVSGDKNKKEQFLCYSQKNVNTFSAMSDISKAKSPDCTSKSGKVKNHSSSLATVHNIPSRVIATRVLCSCPQPPSICTKHQTQISNRNSNIGDFFSLSLLRGTERQQHSHYTATQRRIGPWPTIRMQASPQ